MRGRRLIAVVIVAALSLAVRQRPPRDVLPELPHERVDYWIDQFSHTPEYRKKIEQAFERKPKVEKLLRQKLRDRGMPESLIYLAMEESAFNVEAHSRSEAVGASAAVMGALRRADSRYLTPVGQFRLSITKAQRGARRRPPPAMPHPQNLHPISRRIEPVEHKVRTVGK